MRRPALLAAAALAASALATGRPVPAATITVDGTTCTLADAIRSANDDAAPGASGCADGLDDDLIVLDADEVITLAEAVASGSINEAGGIAGLPDVTSTITIQAGLGDTIERHPTYGCAPEDANAFRVLTVGFSGELTLDGLELRNGCIAPPAPDSGAGGAVYAVGPLTVLGGSFVGNHVRGGSASGTSGSRAEGGAIRATTLSLSDTLLRDNGARGGDSDTAPADALGGAVYVGSGTATVVDCGLRDNTAQGGDFTGAGSCGSCRGANGEGGALTTLSAVVDLRDSVLASNAARGGSGGAGIAGGAAHGGAVSLLSSTGTLLRLRVTNNLARGGDGDLAGGSVEGGGPVATASSRATRRAAATASQRFRALLRAGGPASRLLRGKSVAARSPATSRRAAPPRAPPRTSAGAAACPSSARARSRRSPTRRSAATSRAAGPPAGRAWAARPWAVESGRPGRSPPSRT
jgi:hypothetical protein